MKIIRSNQKIIRDTIQKRIVLRFFKQSKKDFATAEEIYQYAEQIIPTITQATVYRNLRKLIEEREVVEIRLSGRKTVFASRGATESSVVFFCESCENFQIFSDYHLPEILKIQAEKNIQVNQNNFLLSGLCHLCKNDRN